jgi:hypothetical protein
MSQSCERVALAWDWSHVSVTLKGHQLFAVSVNIIFVYDFVVMYDYFCRLNSCMYNDQTKGQHICKALSTCC